MKLTCRRMVSTASYTIALACLLSGAADAAQTDNHVVRAVPVPGASVTVDGMLDDWDLSGQFEVYANNRMKHNYSVKVAGMYDADRFYLALVWRDPTPLHNMIDARFDIGSGWRSDCLQLRLITDMVIGAVDCWYSTAAQKPVINIAYGSFSSQEHRKTTDASSRFQSVSDAVRLGAQQGFTKGEDGKSYTQEIALPWKLITAQSAVIKETGEPYKPPKTYSAGDEFRMGMEFLWGGPDGKTWPIHRYADLLLEGQSDREFFWTAERAWGTVRLEPAGNLPQAENAGGAEDLYQQKTFGPAEFSYEMPFDGFATIVIDDDSGKRVRNLIGTAPRSAGRRTECWDGADDEGKSVPPGRYRWHGLVHAGIDPTYEATYGSPGQPAWGTADGTGEWLSDHNPNVAVATSDDTAVIAASGSEAGWALIGTDLNGKRQWGERKFQSIRDLAVSGAHVYVAMDAAPWHHVEFPSVGRCTVKGGKYAPFGMDGGEQLTVPVATNEEKASIAGIVVVGGKLAVGLSGPDVVRFFGIASMKKLDELAVAEIRDLAVDQSGALVVLTATKILRRSGDTLTPVVSAGLEQPHSIAMDSGGAMYVTDRSTHQVKVFSKDGALVRAIGTKGGRPSPGTWDANGMREPGGIAIDAKGRIWVVEETKFPKRVSVWNADGTLATDFIGPSTYGGMGAMVDPDDKTRVFGNGCEFALDYAKNEYEAVANVLDDNTVGEIIKRDGREYFMAKSSELYMRKGDELVKIASFGSGNIQDPNHKPRLQSLGVFEEAERMGKSVAWMWCDANDDGEPDREEVFIQKDLELRVSYWGGYWLDEDWGLCCITHKDERSVLARIPVSRWSPGGVPIWDAHDLEAVSKQEIAYPTILYIATREMVVVGSGDYMKGLTPHGNEVWRYPDRYNGVHGSHKAPIPERDDTLVGTICVIGRSDSPAGPLFATNSNMGRLYVFTSDGLLAASVFQDNRTGPEAWPSSAKKGSPLGGVTMGGEWFGGYFFKAGGADEWYLIAGSTSYNLIRLGGFETMQRLVGYRFDLTGDDIAVAERMQQERAAATAEAKEIVIAQLATAPEVDGTLDEYDGASFVKWNAASFSCSAAVATHGSDLHLAYTVEGDRNPMVNGGKDWTQLFVTGDSVNLELGTDASADPKRKDAARGDVRLLISVIDTKPVAVLYRWKTDAPEKNTVTFKCPWRTHTVADVRRLDEAAIAIARKGQGYTVEARIPLAAIGFAPQPGKTYKLDLGAIFSDATGTTREARVYWANSATGLVNDVPGEIMAAPNTWGAASVRREIGR